MYLCLFTWQNFTEILKKRSGNAETKHFSSFAHVTLISLRFPLTESIMLSYWCDDFIQFQERYSIYIYWQMWFLGSFSQSFRNPFFFSGKLTLTTKRSSSKACFITENNQQIDQCAKEVIYYSGKFFLLMTGEYFSLLLKCKYF